MKWLGAAFDVAVGLAIIAAPIALVMWGLG